MIATGASRLFSSVFRKRLGAPPPPQEVKLERREEIHDAIAINPPSLEAHSQEEKYVHTSKSNSDGDGISELELLFNQKTFTRAEFDRLTDLLCSRTVDLSTDDREQKIEPTMLKLAVIPDTHEQRAGALERENDVQTAKLFTSSPKPHSSLNESQERIASPTEVAKAYMGSKSFKPALPPASYSIVRREPAASSSSQFLLKASETPVCSKSSIRFPEFTENCSRTPRSHGRSALYQMSRSPYFKAQTMASQKGHELSTEDHGSYLRSRLVQAELSLSAGKQPLKRRSSVLDSDLGSIGPIRRIRQKANLLSKELVVSSPGRYLTASKNGLQGGTASIPMASVADSAKYWNIPEDGGRKDDGQPHVPHQSSQMASKILQLVDQMVPSPKKKILDLKADTEVSPLKLTIDMSNNQALKGVKDIDPANLFTVQENVDADNGSRSHLKISTPIASPIQGEVEKNGHLRSKFSESNDMETVRTVDTKYGMTRGNPSGSAPDVTSKKPAFKMQVPESLLELDTESQVPKFTTSIVATEKEYPSLAAEKPKHFSSEGFFQKSSLVSPPESKLDSSLIPSKEDTQQLQVKVARKNNGFTFPVVPSGSQVPPTPSMPTAFSEQSLPQKEELSAPIFNFGGSVPTLSFSSTASSTSDSSGIKFRSAPSLKLQVTVSASTSTPAAQELPSLSAVRETKEVTESLIPVGNLFPTLSTSTAPVFSFGVSASSSLSNGSLKTSTASSVPSTLNPEPSENLRSISSSSASLSSWAIPITSTKAPSLPEAPAPNGTASSAELATVEKPFRTPMFGTNAITSGAPVTFSTSGSSNIFTFSSVTGTPSGSSTGQFGLQPTHAVATATDSAQTVGSTLSSSAPASSSVAGSSLFKFGSSVVGSSTSSNTSSPFGSNTSGAQSSSTLFTTNYTTSGSSTAISFALPAAAPSLFGASSGSSFASSAPRIFGSSGNASFPPLATRSSLFSSTSQAASSISGSGSSTSSQSTPPIFNSSASSAVFTFAPSSAAATSTQVGFGLSSPAPFSFTSASASSTSTPISGAQTPITFSSSPGNDQMNAEDSMTEDTTLPAMPVMPVFGQTANPPMPSNLQFGSSLQPSGFQFSSQPTPSFPQPQPQFQAPGNLEFTGGGSFSVGSGGGDKSARRIVKVKRDRLRKK